MRKIRKQAEFAKKKEEDLPLLRLNPLPISMGGGTPRRVVKLPLPPGNITEETRSFLLSVLCEARRKGVMPAILMTFRDCSDSHFDHFLRLCLNGQLLDIVEHLFRCSISAHLDVGLVQIFIQIFIII